MKNSVLYKKSQENIKCMNWAEKNGIYCIATSRSYYSIFQKMKLILDTKSNEQLRGFNSNSSSALGSHEQTIEDFTKFYIEHCRKTTDKNKFKKVREINGINELKKLRVKADYYDMYVKKSEYEQLVKYHFGKLDILMNELIEEG